MQKCKVLFIVISILFLGFDLAFSADLKKLMEVGASQADIAKTLQQETNAYNGVKSAVSSGTVKVGAAGDSIRKKYGDPIINTYDKKRGVDKWLYMPAQSTHFKGEKIYLYFDKQNKLTGWDLVEQ